MGAKPTAREGTAFELKGGEDQKMNNIVEEVDRFFKTVHADIEDWKFSMEDYGDGPRIFVRFQIHVNKSGIPLTPAGAEEMKTPPKETDARAVLPSIPTEPTGLVPPEVAKEISAPGGAAAARRADLDLASFVDHWRSTRDNNAAAEFHKEGAPYMDAGSYWKGEKRSSDEASPKVPGELTNDEPGTPNTSN
jgi:hypothetical protein